MTYSKPVRDPNFYNFKTCKARGCSEPLSLSNPWLFTPSLEQYCISCKQKIRAQARARQALLRERRSERRQQARAPKLAILRRTGFGESRVMLTLTTGKTETNQSPLALIREAARLSDRVGPDWTAVSTRGPRGLAVAWSLHILVSPEPGDRMWAERLQRAWAREHPPTQYDQRAVISEHENVVPYFAGNMGEPGAFRRSKGSVVSPVSQNHGDKRTRDHGSTQATSVTTTHRSQSQNRETPETPVSQAASSTVTPESTVQPGFRSPGSTVSLQVSCSTVGPVIQSSESTVQIEERFSLGFGCLLEPQFPGSSPLDRTSLSDSGVRFRLCSKVEIRGCSGLETLEGSGFGGEWGRALLHLEPPPPHACISSGLEAPRITKIALVLWPQPLPSSIACIRGTRGYFLCGSRDRNRGRSGYEPWWRGEARSAPGRSA